MIADLLHLHEFDAWNDHLVELLLEDLHPGVVDIEFQALEVMLNDLQEAVILVVIGLLGLIPVLGQEDEGQHLVHVGQPEDTGYDSIFSLE